MKRILNNLLLLSLSLLMLSCGKDSKEKKTSTLSKIIETTKAVKNQSKNAKKLKGTFEDAQKLAEMEPIDQAKLKEWLPKSVKDYKRTLYKTGELNVMGTSGFNSEYTKEKDADKKISFDVVDGAGSFVATTIAGFNRMLGLDAEEETEHYYKKTVKKQGYTAVEEQNNNSKKAKITFVHNNRFMITVEGKNQTAEDLWEFIGMLPLKQLK